MIRKVTYSLVFLLVAAGIGFAQRPVKKKMNTQRIKTDSLPPHRTCHTMVVDSMLRAKNKSMKSLAQFEKNMAVQVDRYKQKRQAMRTTSANDTMYIPVIVHVVHNGQDIGTAENITAAQVYSQLDVLNEDYTKRAGTAGYNTNPVGAGLAVKFVPALVKPNGRDLEEPGIHRYNGGRSSWDNEDDVENILKPATIFDPERYLNIWVAAFGGSIADLLGYAQFPEMSGLPGLDESIGETTGNAASTDGLIIRYNSFGRTGNVTSPYNIGRTTTHELGHFFGLRHIWGDADNCTGTDYCDDTPPTSGATYGCPSRKASCTSGVVAMIENYLDYTNDSCMNIFTEDQKTRMLTVLDVSPRRKNLLTSNVYFPGSIPSANFYANINRTCANSVITFSGSTAKNPTYYEWRVYDESDRIIYTVTGVAQTNYLFTKAGNYSVIHIIGNSFGNDTLKKVNYVTILPDSVSAIPFTENFENSSKINWTAYNPLADSTWQLTDLASANGIGEKSVFFNNYDTTYSAVGNKNGIISPKFDFSLPTNNAYLTFDVAYAVYNDYYTDTLQLYYSTDCGKTYSSFWEKGGRNLATTTDRDTSFIPAANEWRHEQISLGFLNGYTDVNFLFINLSGWGNNVYLDNINISSPNRTGVPSSSFIATPRTVCSGSMVSFSDKSTQFPTQWKWTFTEKSGKATSFSTNQQNPNVVFQVAGTYNVSLTASNSIGTGSTSSIPGYVVVADYPTINITSNRFNDAVSCHQSITLTASGGLYYTWYDDSFATILGTGNKLTVTPLKNTTYVVYGKNAYGCESYDYIDVTSGCTTDVIYPSTDNTFNIYPNPASDKLMIETISSDISGYILTIADLTGKTHLSETITTVSSVKELSIQKLPAGIYIVNLSGNGFNYYKKLVKE